VNGRDAWAFRARVEREAALRFARLAEEIAAFDPESPVPAMMRKAAEDERRHLALCEELAGGPVPGVIGEDRIAPRSFGPREAALYETVAACCITETESVATVTSLLAFEDAEPRVREVLHEIARDEVGHSRMGWAHLARESGFIDVSFLASWIPSMLVAAAGNAFEDALPEPPDLPRYGVLPVARKRDVFVQTLQDVVLPGLEQFGISTGPARAWLSERSRAAGA
jgi:hypothetical protein